MYCVFLQFENLVLLELFTLMTDYILENDLMFVTIFYKAVKQQLCKPIKV